MKAIRTVLKPNPEQPGDHRGMTDFDDTVPRSVVKATEVFILSYGMNNMSPARGGLEAVAICTDASKKIFPVLLTELTLMETPK